MDTEEDLSGYEGPSGRSGLGDRFGGGLDGAKVRWGRIVVLVVALQLAFFMGRACAPGVSQTELDRAENALAESQDELARTKAAAQATPTPTPTPIPTPTATTGATPSPGATTGTETLSYTVKSGDTLAEIAEQFYRDADLDDFLAEANNIADKSKLRVGQKLSIPPKSTATATPAPTPTPTSTPTSTSRP